MWDADLVVRTVRIENKSDLSYEELSEDPNPNYSEVWISMEANEDVLEITIRNAP